MEHITKVYSDRRTGLTNIDVRMLLIKLRLLRTILSLRLQRGLRFIL